MKKYIANTITICRILCSISMLFLSVYSAQFYILYLFSGFSDMVDGIVARITNSDSDFGAGLDTVADFIFVVVSLFKFLPLIQIPRWLWGWIVVIAMIKISNIIWAIVYKKRLTSLHTIMNKTTGILLFIMPFTLHIIELKYSSIVVCLTATFSAIQEGYYIVTDREFF